MGMSKMKILTINHHITDGRVMNRANFMDAEALFDFDVVIIQPPSIPSLLMDNCNFTDTPKGIQYNRINNFCENV